MTAGRSGIFKTAYGTLEFTHSKKPQAKVVDKLYFGHDILMFRASTELACEDLKSVGRSAS